jgi:ferritin
MFTDAQLARLNGQIASEAFVSRYYLSISCWAESQGLAGAAQFFRAHHESEELHMHKMMDYVLETGGSVVVGAVKAPPAGFKTMVEALKVSLEQEQQVTASFNEMVDAFLSEKDHSTVNFLQWFVAEQHEEESLFRSLIGKAELIGNEQRGQFWLDRELAEAAQAERTPA